MYPMNTGTSPWGYFDEMGIWRDWGAPANIPRTPTPSSPLANFHMQATSRVPTGSAGRPIATPAASARPATSASAPKTTPKTAKASTATAASAAAGAADAAGAAATAKSKGKFFKEGGFFDSKSGKFGGVVGGIANPQFDYDTKTGLKGWGRNLGNYWTLGQMALQGYGALQDLQNAGDYRDRSEDLMSDVVSASYNSPTIQYDLAPDQMETLRQLRDGDYETGTDLGDLDLLSVLGDVGMGVLGGIPGGIGGMVLGGLGGLGTSLASNYSNAQSRQTAELEALYQAVLESEKQHNDLRKQRAHVSYGLGGY